MSASDEPIYASIILDDFPLNATYWQRRQMGAMGYERPAIPECAYSRNWPALEKAPFMTAELTHEFVEFINEFDVRGKFTVMPCPAGLGRIDESVRTLDDAELKEILQTVRDGIVPRFDITPEVLTHTMALDLETGALLPHGESPYLSYLTESGRHEELAAYLDRAYEILLNVGITPAGVTIGGIADVSGISGDKTLLGGYHHEAFAGVLMGVVGERVPERDVIFGYVGGVAPSERGKRGFPEVALEKDGKVVFDLWSIGEATVELLYGDRDPEANADEWVSRDLESGRLIEAAEAGNNILMSTHSQCLDAMRTGNGLKGLREIVRRLKERYGERLQWKTPTELYMATMNHE